MERLRGAVTGIFVFVAFWGGAVSAMDYAERGPYESTTVLETWSDASRERDLPIKLYIPDREGPLPVVIFSHGLGGSREAAPYLGEQWASWGFLGVFVQHPGSDVEVWRGKRGREALEALRESVKTPASAIARYGDIPFVVAQIKERSADGSLAADPDRIGMSGHSFGAHTTLAALGRRFPVAPGRNFEAPELKAGMMLSPPPITQTDPAWLATTFGSVKKPMLHMTGTEDASPMSADEHPEHRLVPYAQIRGAPQYLTVFDGGDHRVFGGRSVPWRQNPDWYPEVQQATAAISTAFWFAYLLDDDDAADWLESESVRGVLRSGDRFEFKSK